MLGLFRILSLSFFVFVFVFVFVLELSVGVIGRDISAYIHKHRVLKPVYVPIFLRTFLSLFLYLSLYLSLSLCLSSLFDKRHRPLCDNISYEGSDMILG